jgi:CheY-like chemotaxis protein/nitrogen-specific signal transduction histidine kinase
MLRGLDVAELLARAERARADAEAANRSKDDFLATLSHELRTPLNAILGWAQMCRSGKLAGAEMERALEAIERNARAQAQLVEDILDVSRIIAGKLRLHVSTVDVRGFVEAAMDAVRPAAQAKKIALDLVIEGEDQVESVRGDMHRLEQVVWNLLSNAIKFTPLSGHVLVRVWRAAEHISIEVRDDGKGIPATFLPLVFERYRQADGAITRAHGGLGLGLAIVRFLVELHGGSVRAESPGEGLGASFTVRLPAELGPRDSDFVDGTTTQVENAPRLEELRILVVDDEPDARELMTLMLQQSGAEVVAVGDLPSALAAYESFRPNLLVSDIGLPGEDGYALVGRLRALAQARGQALPAVALTAFAGEEHAQKALDAGFQMHVPKPVEPEALLAVISRVSGWVPARS